MGYISTGMDDHFGDLLVLLMALWLTVRDQNPFQPCFTHHWYADDILIYLTTESRIFYSSIKELTE